MNLVRGNERECAHDAPVTSAARPRLARIAQLVTRPEAARTVTTQSPPPRSVSICLIWDLSFDHAVGRINNGRNKSAQDRPKAPRAMAPERSIMDTKNAPKKLKLKVRTLEEKIAPNTCGKVPKGGGCLNGAIGAVMDI